MSFTPEHARFLLTDVFLPTLEREHPTTRRVIEAIPSSGGDYRPDAVSKTAMELAWHIVAAEKRFLEGIAAGEFNFAPISRPENVCTGADIGRWYGEMIQAVLPHLRQMTGEQLTRSIDFRGIFQAPAVLFLQTSLNHSIHHRGQLYLYLAMLDVPAPPLYGLTEEEVKAASAR